MKKVLNFLKRVFGRKYIDLSKVKHLTEQGMKPLF